MIAGVAVLVASCATRPTPIADRAIDLDGRCVQREEDGFSEDATLVVEHSTVRALAWRIALSQRGQCRFDLAEFRQTKKRPHIELAATDGSRCKLLVWQQPGRVTLAHADCQAHCTPGIYDSAWPVLFDPQSGGCGRFR